MTSADLAVLHHAMDGRHTYRSGMVPTHLATRRQLRTAGLSIAGLTPAGWLHYSAYHGVCALYDRRLANPVRTLTDRQREALAQGRSLANTAECHRCHQTRVRWYPAWAADGDRPLCPSCLATARAERRRAHLRREREAAERFRQQLADDRAAAARWAGDVLSDPNAVVLDTETTDLDGWVVELAVVAMDGTVLLDTMVDPLVAIPEGAAAIHGITNETVSGAPTFVELLPEMEALLAGKRIVIYNATFDVGTIFGELRRAWYGDELAISFWELGERRRNWAGGALARAQCAMRQHARWYGDWSDHHSSYTWQPLNGGHRAAADCQAVLDRLAVMSGGQRPLFLVH